MRAALRRSMVDITLNGVKKALPGAISIKDLVDQLGYDRRRIAVEVNQEVVPCMRHPERQLQAGDTVEIVTLVGGGSGVSGAKRVASGEQEDSSSQLEEDSVSPLATRHSPLSDKPLKVGKLAFQSRLI